MFCTFNLSSDINFNQKYLVYTFISYSLQLKSRVITIPEIGTGLQSNTQEAEPAGSVCPRPAWATWQVLTQPQLCNGTLSQ